MNSFQRIVKYFAIALATIICLSIIGGIGSAILAITGLYDHEDTECVSESEDEVVSENKEYDGIERLDIQGSVCNVEILVGDTFRVETKDVPETMKITKKSDGTLKIVSPKHIFHLFGLTQWNKNAKIIIYLPEEFVAEEVYINSGAGKVYIEKLITDRLKLEAGAGNIEGSDIIAKKVDIDGGVGNIDFDQVEFTDAEISTGVGDVDISGKLYGDNDLDCGVGNVELSIDESIEEYNLYIDSGVGTVRLDGDKVGDINRKGAEARHSIDIDGGVGSIEIEYTSDK